MMIVLVFHRHSSDAHICRIVPIDYGLLNDLAEQLFFVDASQFHNKQIHTQNILTICATNAIKCFVNQSFFFQFLRITATQPHTHTDKLLCELICMHQCYSVYFVSLASFVCSASIAESTQCMGRWCFRFRTIPARNLCSTDRIVFSQAITHNVIKSTRQYLKLNTKNEKSRNERRIVYTG